MNFVDEEVRMVGTMTKSRFIKATLVFEVIIILTYLSIYIYVTKYTNIAVDDFALLNDYNNAKQHNLLSKSLEYTIYKWQSWQGTYFSFFFGFYAIDLYIRIGAKALWIEMAMAILLFFAAIIFFAYAILNRTCEKGSSTFAIVFLYGIILLNMILYDNPGVSECFYWHSVVCTYTMPLICALMATSIMLLKKVSWVRTMLASVIAFLAAGGPLNIGAFVCVALLLLLVYKVASKEEWQYNLVVFGAGLAGTLLNLFAPGNFVRFARISDWDTLGGKSCFGSMISALQGVFYRNLGLISGGTLPLLFIVAMVSLGLLKRSELHFFNPLMLAIILFLMEVVIDFPFILGVGRMQLRGEFIARVVAVLFLAICIIDCAGYFSRKYDIEIEINCLSVCLILIVISMVFLPLLPKRTRNEYYPFKMIDDIYSGELRKFLNGNDLIFDRLEECKNSNEDLIVEVWDYTYLDYIKTCGLTNDENHWMNLSAAEYYGLNSIQVIYK